MISKLKINELVALQLVAETGSYSRAGHTIGVQGRVIGVRIASLETKLGFPLVDGKPGSITLTPAGSFYLGRVAEALYVLAEASREAQAIVSGDFDVPNS